MATANHETSNHTAAFAAAANAIPEGEEGAEWPAQDKPPHGYARLHKIEKGIPDHGRNDL
jgi:hypothetical protein